MAETGNLVELTVSELSQALKRVVETQFDLVRVRGEISGFKRAASGHMYMGLKDEQSVMDAVCWRGNTKRLDCQPEDGLEVVITGRLTTYPGRSKYQLIIERMELAGLGALMKLFEERKQKLANEGLFAAERKRQLPFLPTVIGVVTSPTGAVIRDILHRLAERFPRRVLLWPVLVQGDGAAAQIAAGIDGLNALDGTDGLPRPDVLIVARGGGSIEDLWAFNEEIVVRAAAASTIPLISAVGHETDTTLIDFAADLRAPTPTAAAELAVPVRLDLVAAIESTRGRLVNAIQRGFRLHRQELTGLARGLIDPQQMLNQARQRVDDNQERLQLAASNLVAAKRARIAALSGWMRSPKDMLALQRERLRGLLARADTRFRSDIERRRQQLTSKADLLRSLSHQSVLERGYTIVRDAESGRLIKTAAEASIEASLRIDFADDSLVVRHSPGAKPKRRSAAKASPAAAENKQGSLL